MSDRNDAGDDEPTDDPRTGDSDRWPGDPDGERNPERRHSNGPPPDGRWTPPRGEHPSDGQPRPPDGGPQGPPPGGERGGRRRASGGYRDESGPRRRGPRGGRSPRSRLRREADTGGADPDRIEGDPVKTSFAGRVDLYDIATWESRTVLDSFAVSLSNALRAGRTVVPIVVALGLFLLQGGVVLLIIAEEPVLGVLAVSSVLPAFGVAGYLWYGDPTRREPLVTLAGTFVLSLLFAGFAGVVNTTLQPVFGLLGVVGLVGFYFLVVGPIEEFVKWLAIRIYAFRGEAFQTVVDGVVYGAVAGLGFAAIENVIYIVSIYMEADGTAGIAATEAATEVAAQRFFVGPGHVVYSSWAGFYLGLAKFNPENRTPIVVKGLLIAVFIHGLYNSAVSVLPTVLSGLGVFGFIVLYDGFWFVLLYRKVRAYRELYRAEFPERDERSPGRRPR
jgi:RsiW-degrading membrane proteinase PrsW (M82 family)